MGLGVWMSLEVLVSRGMRMGRGMRVHVASWVYISLGMLVWGGIDNGYSPCVMESVGSALG